MKLVTIGVLLALVAWAALERWAILTGSPFPLGVDGYFYPVQLRALLERGGLAYPDAPVVYALMAPFAAALGPIQGVKLAAAILTSLVAVPAYGVGARLGGSRAAGLVAAVLAATSAGATFMAMEFVKNGVALGLALAALWLVLRAAEAPTRGAIALACAGAVVAVASHKLAAALVLGLGGAAVLAALVGRGLLRGRRLVYALAGTAALAAIVLGAAPDARALLGGLLAGRARWDAPALEVGRVRLVMGHEALLAAGLALVGAVGLSRRAPPAAGPAPLPAAARGLGWAVIALALVTALPWLAVDDPQGLAFRLRVAAFVPLALAGALAVRALHAPVARGLARLAGPARAPRAVALAGALAAAALFVAAPARRTEGQVRAHPAMVAAITALAGEVPDGGVVIIPERHLMFMVAWYTRLPVRLRPEPVPPARRWRLLPLSFIGADSALDRALMDARAQPALVPPRGLHPRHPNGLVLLPEATWAWALDQLPPAARAHYARWRTI